MEAWDLYWITRLDGIGISVFILAVFSFILTGIVTIANIGASDREREQDSFVIFSVNHTGKLYCLTILLCGSSILIPTSKEVMAFISIDYITHEEKVVDTADKLYEVLDQYLDNKLEEGEKK